MRARIGSVDPTLAAIVAEGFFSRLSFGLISFALPLYAVRELGLSLAQVGILLSLNLMVAVLLKPFMGALADRVGMKPSLTAAIGLRSLVSLLLAFAAVPWQLFAIRAVHGVSISLRDPPANVLIAEHGGKKAVATAFAWYQTAKSLAGNAGKASAGILLTLTAANYTFVFLLAFVLSALPILIVLRSIEEPRGGGSEQEHVPVAAAEREQPRSTNQAPRLLPFMGLGFMISSTAYMLANLFPVFAVEYVGLSEAQAGLVYVVSMVVVLSGPAFGWLSDNVSRSLVLSVRSVANVLSSAVYLAAPNLAGVLIGRAIDDTGKAAFRPAWGSVMAHVAGFDRQRRARTMGALSSGEDAGEIAGPVLAGLLWSMWGVPVLLAVRIGLAVAAEAYAIVLLRSIDRPRPDVVLLEPSRRWRGTDDSVGAWLARAAPGARPEEIARAWSRAGLSVPLQAVWTQPLAALTADDRSRLPHAASLAADPAALARGDLVSMSEPTAHARTPTASSPAGS
jgi:MFS family permease